LHCHDHTHHSAYLGNGQGVRLPAFRVRNKAISSEDTNLENQGTGYQDFSTNLVRNFASNDDKGNRTKISNQVLLLPEIFCILKGKDLTVNFCILKARNPVVERNLLNHRAIS